jgi:hypothetical protein
MHSIKSGALEIVVNESTLPLASPSVARTIAGLSPGEVEKLLKHSYRNCNNAPPANFELMGIVKRQKPTDACPTITSEVGKPTQAYLFRLVAVEVANAPEPIGLNDSVAEEE